MLYHIWRPYQNTNINRWPNLGKTLTVQDRFWLTDTYSVGEAVSYSNFLICIKFCKTMFLDPPACFGRLVCMYSVSIRNVYQFTETCLSSFEFDSLIRLGKWFNSLLLFENLKLNWEKRREIWSNSKPTLTMTRRNPVEDVSFGLNCKSSWAQYPWVVSLILCGRVKSTAFISLSSSLKYNVQWKFVSVCKQIIFIFCHSTWHIFHPMCKKNVF